MKKPLFTIGFAFLFIATLSAQGEGLSKQEQIYAQKVGFLTSQMGLSASDAEKFWPVYNQREEELEELKKGRRESRKKYRGAIESASDKELEQYLDGEIASKQKELDIKKGYHARFKELIGVKKTAKLYRAEILFNAKLVRGARDKAGKRLQERTNERGLRR